VDIKKTEIKPGVTALHLSGRFLMGPDCEQLGQELEQVLAGSGKRVILDLSGVYQIDSAGVGKVVMCFSRMKKSGGQLRLAGITGMLDGVFKMTQVHKVIPIFPTVADASQNF
jgi:anti-sigma B factor antagonist